MLTGLTAEFHKAALQFTSTDSHCSHWRRKSLRQVCSVNRLWVAKKLARYPTFTPVPWPSAMWCRFRGSLHPPTTISVHMIALQTAVIRLVKESAAVTQRRRDNFQLCGSRECSQTSSTETASAARNASLLPSAT